MFLTTPASIRYMTTPAKLYTRTVNGYKPHLEKAFEKQKWEFLDEVTNQLELSKLGFVGVRSLKQTSPLCFNQLTPNIMVFHHC